MASRDSDKPAPALSIEETIRCLVNRLDRIEKRLDGFESQLPSLASFVEAVTRLADHCAPEPANIVGSKYVADRLGCTTTWIGRMATNGTIPRGCIVQGTGNGRLSKFYRKRINN